MSSAKKKTASSRKKESTERASYLSDSPLELMPPSEIDRIIADHLRSKAQREASVHQKHKNAIIATNVARENLFLEQLGHTLSTVFENKVHPLRYVTRSKKTTQRIVNLLWSDHHYGARLERRELGVQFGPVEEARRLAQLAVQAADYKRQYRAESELYIHIVGDMIQGQLHDLRDGAPLAEQVASAIHILTQAIAFLAGEYKKVTVFCTPGNHGRNTARHKERATNQKWDSIENIMYFSIQNAFKGVANVTVNIDYKPFYLYDAFGETGFMTHGDTVLKPGNPGKNINVNGLRHQMNEYNASHQGAKKVSLFGVGHVHTASVVHLANGATFMSNGALIPPDGFAQSIGIFDSACGQWIWESVPGRILGDHRLIYLDSNVDKDSSLDKIVKPFIGF